MLHDRRIPMISATGSTNMGRHVAEVVGRRLAKTLLELGGNNGIIVMEDANLDLVLRACLFAAVGTAGQRCTTLRRLFLHRKIADTMINRLIAAYKQVRIGPPLIARHVDGPADQRSGCSNYFDGLERIREQGGEVLYGGVIWAAAMSNPPSCGRRRICP